MQEVQEVIKSAGDAGIAKMCRCCWCCYAITKKGRISATSHHPNTSSNHWLTTHAFCKSAACQHSNQAKLSFHCHPNDSTVTVNGHQWPLWV